MKEGYEIKKRWILLGIIVLFLIYMTEGRRFHYTDDGRYFTVWKTWGRCYTMPYKYYGLIKPSDNYIQTNYTADIDIFWTDSLPNDLIVRATDYRIGFYVKIFNKKPKKYFIYNYFDDEEKYKKMLFKPNLDGKEYLNGIYIYSYNSVYKFLSEKNQQNLKNQQK